MLKQKMTKREYTYPQQYLELKDDRGRLLFLAMLGSLAPSSHNMQPWLFKIANNSITVLPNFKRKLKVADPSGREFFITLGTLIKNLDIASKAYGLKYTIELGNDTSKKIASFNYTDLTPSNPNFQVLEALIQRHNSRLPFDGKEISENIIAELKKHQTEKVKIDFIKESEIKGKIKKITLDSVRKAFKDTNFRKELAPWLKPSLGYHDDGLVGKNLGMPFFISLIFPLMTRYTDTSELQVKIFNRMLENVPVHCVISTQIETPETWLDVGQVFEAVAIEAQSKGLSLGVMQAAIEDAEYNREFQSILNNGQKPQMFFRIGYTNKIHVHSPRIDVNKLTVN